jgi:hypothetical protein
MAIQSSFSLITNLTFDDILLVLIELKFVGWFFLNPMYQILGRLQVTPHCDRFQSKIPIHQIYILHIFHFDSEEFPFSYPHHHPLPTRWSTTSKSTCLRCRQFKSKMNSTGNSNYLLPWEICCHPRTMWPTSKIAGHPISVPWDGRHLHFIN